MLRLAALKPVTGLISNHGKVMKFKFDVQPFLSKANRKSFSSVNANPNLSEDGASSLLRELDLALQQKDTGGNQKSEQPAEPRSNPPKTVLSDFEDLGAFEFKASFSRESRGFESRESRGFESRENRRGGFSESRRESEQIEVLKVEEKSDFDYSKYENVSVEIRGQAADTAKPIASFEEMQLHPLLLQNIKRRNYTKPVAMQQYTVPLALQNKDLMMCAQTGSGKTAAFLFPIISRLLTEGTGKFPKALIMAPTRELAQQISAEAIEFIRGTNLRTAVIFGGASSTVQISQLRALPSIIIGTPGRLNDMVSRGALNLKDIKHLVLDEADRMLDMGFEHQIRQIIEDGGIPDKGVRQTMMFSATFPKEIQKLAEDFMGKYTFLSFGRIGTATETVEQSFIHAESQRVKYQKVMELVAKHAKNPQEKVLVFFEQKRAVDEFEFSLRNSHDVEALCLHGDKSQYDRNNTLKIFASGKANILLATSVASRGLDLKNITHVINVGLPRDMDDYVHRVGRTGRSGKSGKAITVISRDDSASVGRLIQILKEAKKPVPSWLEEMDLSGRRGSSSYGGNRGLSFGANRGSSSGGSSYGASRGSSSGGSSYGGSSYGASRGSSSGGSSYGGSSYGGDRNSSYGGDRNSSYGGDRNSDRGSYRGDRDRAPSRNRDDSDQFSRNSRRDFDDDSSMDSPRKRKSDVEKILDNL